MSKWAIKKTNIPTNIATLTLPLLHSPKHSNESTNDEPWQNNIDTKYSGNRAERTNCMFVVIRITDNRRGLRPDRTAADTSLTTQWRACAAATHKKLCSCSRRTFQKIAYHASCESIGDLMNTVFADYGKCSNPQCYFVDVRLWLITINFGLNISSYCARPYSIISRFYLIHYNRVTLVGQLYKYCRFFPCK